MLFAAFLIISLMNTFLSEKKIMLTHYAVCQLFIHTSVFHSPNLINKEYNVMIALVAILL